MLDCVRLLDDAGATTTLLRYVEAVMSAHPADARGLLLANTKISAAKTLIGMTDLLIKHNLHPRLCVRFVGLTAFVPWDPQHRDKVMSVAEHAAYVAHHTLHAHQSGGGDVDAGPPRHDEGV